MRFNDKDAGFNIYLTRYYFLASNSAYHPHHHDQKTWFSNYIIGSEQIHSWPSSDDQQQFSVRVFKWNAAKKSRTATSTRRTSFFAIWLCSFHCWMMWLIFDQLYTMRDLSVQFVTSTINVAESYCSEQVHFITTELYTATTHKVVENKWNNIKGTRHFSLFCLYFCICLL